MASRTWTGTSGDWNTGSLWSGGTIPGAADTAIFNGTLSYQAEIGLNGTAADAVGNVTLTDANATLQIDTGSSLAVSSVFSLLAGSLSLESLLSGGTLLGQGGSLEIGGDLYQGTGTLSHETIAGTVQAGGYFGTLDVTGGVAFQAGGVLAIGHGSDDTLAFLDSETLSGGAIALQEYGGTLAATAGAVTFAQGFTLDVTSAAALSGSFVNHGTVVVAAGAELALAPASFSNTGIIDLGSDAALELGSLTTAQLAALAAGVSNTGGFLSVIGTLANTGATLDLAGGALASGLDLSDATVLGGTILAPVAPATVSLGTLSNVTYQGTLAVPYSVSIVNGVRLVGAGGTGPGALAFTGYDQVVFLDSETLDSATVTVAGSYNTISAPGALTFGPQLNVKIGAGDIAFAAATLVNDGVISVAASGTADFLFTGANFTNAGTIAVAAGGAVQIGGSLTTAQLAADLAGLRNAGTVELVGTVINTGATLNLPGAVALDGDIVGGTVLNAGSLTVAGGTLAGVTFQGPLNFGPGRELLTVTNGITLDSAAGAAGGTIDMGGTYGTLVLTTAENFAAGVLTMTGGHDTVIALTPTLTFGAGFAVTASGLATIAATTLVNAGLILAASPGTEINLATSTLVNSGTVAIAAGDTLDLGFDSGKIAQGQSLSLTGALSLAPGSTLDLGSSETTAQLTALLAGDTGLAVGLSGTVTNTGTSLGVGAHITSLAITADLIGGTVVNGSGGVLVGTSTLDGVTFDGPLATGTAAATISVRDGLTLLTAAGAAGGTVALNGSDQSISITDAETLDNAAVTLAGNYDGISATTGTLNLGAHLTLAVGGGPAASASLSAPRIVTAAGVTVAPGATLDLAATTIVNTGRIGVAAGGVLEVGVGAFGPSLSLANTGSIALAAGSTLALGGTMTTAQALALLGTQTGVTVELEGTLINTGATFATGSGVLANVTLAGGDIVGGVVATAGLSVASGTLAGATLRGPLTLGSLYSSLDITGGITLQSAAGAAGGTIVLAAANQQLELLDSEILNNATILVTGTQDAIVESGTLLSFGTAAMVDVLGSAAISAGSLVNNGSLVAGGSGGKLLLDTATITNGGIIAAGAGDVVGIGVDQYGDSLSQTLSVNTGGLPHTGGGISPFGLTLATGSTLELGAIATTAQLSSLLGSATGVAVSLLGTLVNTGTSVTSIANGTLANLLLDADIIGGTIANRGGSVTVSGGTLDGVTFAGPLDLDNPVSLYASANLKIRDGLHLLPATGTGLGTINVSGHAATLEFADSETLATVVVNTGTSAFDLTADTPTLTLAATATLAIGGAATFTAATIVNAGTIATTGTDASVDFASGTIFNSGIVSVGAGDTLSIDSSAAAGLGDVLDLVNSRSISVGAGGTLVIGSTETTAQLLALVGSLAPAGVTIVVDGTLINTGAVLNAAGSLANLVLDADVIGGTIANASGSLAVTGGTFDGVTFQGALDLTGGGARLAIVDGLALATGAAIVAESYNQTLAILDNTALDTVAVSVGSLGSDFVIETATPTLTLGAQVVIDASSHVLLAAGSTIVSGADVTLATGGEFQDGALDFDADTIFNSGIVTAAAGTELGIDPDGPLAAGATLDLVNTGSFAIAPGATLAVGGAQTTAQRVALVDAISQAGVSLILDGSLDNSGAVLTLAPGVFGDVTLNGTIGQGTIDAAGADVGFGHAQFQTVTFQGPLTIDSRYAYLGITGGLTVLNTIPGLPGSVSLSGSGDTIDFAGTQSLDDATILVSGRDDTLAHGTLTLGTGITLSVSGGLTDGSQFAASELINRGSISVTGALLLNDQTVVNTGVLNVAAYGVLGVALAPSSGPSLPFLNSGSVSLAAGSTILVGGAETDAQLLALLGSLSNPGVVVELDGSLTNTGSVLTTTAGGLLNDVILAATVIGGTVATGTGTLTVLGGEFEGVTYQGNLTLGGGAGVLDILDGITLANGTGPASVLVAGNEAGINFLDAQDTLTNAVLTFSGRLEQLEFQTLTLAQPVDIQVSGDVDLSGRTLVSYSDMSELGSSATLEINAATFTNDALIAVGAGDLLDLENFNGAGGLITVGGTGSITFAAGSTLELGGTATPAQLTAEITALVGTQAGVAIELDGVILNTGTTLTITPTGPFSDVILDASVTGGTIADNGTVIVVGGEFNGVVFQGPALVMPGLESGLEIRNGLSIETTGGAAGTLDMTGNSDQLLLLDTAPTLDNVTFQVSGLNDQIVAQVGSSVTLGANFTGDITGFGLIDAETITTAATIDIPVGAVFELSANTIFNSGTIFVGTQSQTNVSASGSGGVISGRVFGAALAIGIVGLGPDTEDPFGTYSPARKLAGLIYDDPNNIVFGADSGLALGGILKTGQLPALFADFDTQPDVVIFDGSIDNTAATLEITPTGTLSNVLLEAIVSNGTIVDDGALSFAKTTTLTNVSFIGPALDVSANSYASVVLTNSTVLGAGGAQGTIDINGTHDGVFVDGAVVPGTLTDLVVNLAMVQGATADNFIVDGGTVSLGVNVTIDVGGAASINVYTGGYYATPGNAGLTNSGVIIDDGALVIGTAAEPGASFVNAGVITVGPAALPPTGKQAALTIYGSFANAGLIAVSGPELVAVASGSFYNSGTINLAGGATLDFQVVPASFGTITMADGAETLRYDDVAPFAATVAGFDGTDIIDLTAVPFAGTLAVSETFAGGVVDVFEGTTLAAAITLPSFAYAAGNLAVQRDAFGGTEIVTNVPAPCFFAGTRISTVDGDVAVEDLRPGAMVITAAGQRRPVMWIGQRRVDCRRHPRPDLVQPIRVVKNAFGEGLPVRDLLLSPDHSLFVDNVLIPVHHLLNGATIVRDRVASAHYFHVELSAHDVLLAEGLPAESYLDTGNRRAFADGGAPMVLHPDFFPKTWNDACAPLVRSGPVVAAVRARLLARARAVGYVPGPGTAPTLVADGREIRASVSRDGLLRFLLPAGSRMVTIASGAGVPSALREDVADSRVLGVAIGGLLIDGRLVDLDGPALVSGFYPTEVTQDGMRFRWTDGHGEVDLPVRDGARIVELKIMEQMEIQKRKDFFFEKKKQKTS